MSCRIILLALLAVLALAAYGVAQTPIVSSGGRFTSIKDPAMSAGQVRVSRLIDATVYDDSDRDIGHIKDVALDVNEGRATYVAISHAVGPFERKTLAVPYAAMKYGSPDDARVFVRASRRTLDQAPGYDAAKAWPIEANPTFYASNDPSLKKALDEAKVSDQTEMAQVAAAHLNPEHAAPWTRRASQWIGREVRSANGDRIGQIEDLVIDCKSGGIAYACIEEDPAFNPGHKYLAVPISQLRSTPDSERLVMSIGSNDIKAMAGFDKEHWPAMPASPQPTGKDGLESLSQ